jgi:hypothetical protein
MIVISRVTAAPSVILRPGTSAPSRSPPACTTQREHLVRSLRAPSAPARPASARAGAGPAGRRRRAARGRADAACLVGARGATMSGGTYCCRVAGGAGCIGAPRQYTRPSGPTCGTSPCAAALVASRTTAAASSAVVLMGPTQPSPAGLGATSSDSCRRPQGVRGEAVPTRPHEGLRPPGRRCGPCQVASPGPSFWSGLPCVSPVVHPGTSSSWQLSQLIAISALFSW